MSVTRTPTLAEALDAILRARLARVWTALPGIIHTYDATKQKADVRPAVLNRIATLDGEDLLAMPVVPGVPVVHPSGGGFFASFPLQPGDPVLLVFASRSVDVWKDGAGGTPVDPNDLRTHDLSDAFAIPGGHPFGAPLRHASAQDLVIGNDKGTLITVKPAGDVEVGSPGATLQFVALATKVLAELQDLQKHFAALEGVLTGAPVNEPGNGSQSALQIAIAAAIGASPYPAPQSVAGSVLKAAE
jgi:hypothetical protein